MRLRDTPYTTPPEGTEQTVNKLTGDDLKRYYISLLNKNKIFIVAAGNITKRGTNREDIGIIW